MRLIRPNPGELADRQTIVQLKAKFGAEKKLNIQPFLDENEVCQRYLEKNWFPDILRGKEDTFNALFEQLAEVNLQIWKLTDQQHILRDAPDRLMPQAAKRAAECLFDIADLNDKRADLVCSINALFRVNVQEKIYA